MVITPQQTTQIHGRKNQAQLRALENVIDQNLMEGRTTMPIEGGMNAHLRRCLVHKYEQAGWNVQYAVDPKNGEYLFFTEHKEVRGFRPY